MSRIRIVCKAPSPSRPEPHSTFPTFAGQVASWPDVDLTAIGDDGTEVALYNVTAVTFRAAQGPKPASATIEFINVEIDAEAELVAPESDAQPCPACSGLGRRRVAIDGRTQISGTDDPTAPTCSVCEGSCMVFIRPCRAGARR